MPEPLSNFDTVVGACPHYAILRDVAAVDKHFHKNRPNKYGDTFLISKDDIHEVNIVTWYRDEQGDYRNSQQAILLLLHADPVSGMRKDILVVMTHVINYWIGILYDNGVIRENALFQFVEVQHISRGNAKEDHFNFPIMIPHEVEIVHVVYNEHENTISPIDPSVQRMTKFKVEWDKDVVGQYSFSARFEPEGSDGEWTLEAETVEGDKIETFVTPVTYKIGPY